MKPVYSVLSQSQQSIQLIGAEHSGGDGSSAPESLMHPRMMYNPWPQLDNMVIHGGASQGSCNGHFRPLSLE